MKRDLAELGFRRDSRERAGDCRRLRTASRHTHRIYDLAFSQKKKDELVRQPDRDVPGHARRPVALGITDEVSKVNVGELGSPEENAPVREPQLCGVSGHRVGIKEKRLRGSSLRRNLPIT
jgi:hypothetical protein